MPDIDPIDMEKANLNEYPDYIFFDDYFRITLIADEAMELNRYNKYYSEDKVVFDEIHADEAILKIWKHIKKYDPSIQGFKKLKVYTYEELITVMGLAHSTGAWEGIPKKMVQDGSLPLAEMVGSRDDVFLYLKKIGFDNKEAFFIMERVRKGRRPTEEQIAKMKDYGAEEWFVDFCQHALYLFSRSHIAQMIRRNTFCLRDPQVYKDVPHYHGHVVLSGSFMG